MEVIEILQGYLDELEEAREKVQALEDDAQRVNAQAEARSASRERIEALQREGADLRREKDTLQAEYARALFQGDTGEQRTIQNRRKKIDERLESIEGDVLSLSQSESPDANELAELAIKRDRLINPPKAEEVLSEVEDFLEAERDAIRKRTNGIKLPRGLDQKRYAVVGKLFERGLRLGDAGERFVLFEGLRHHPDTRPCPHVKTAPRMMPLGDAPFLGRAERRQEADQQRCHQGAPGD